VAYQRLIEAIVRCERVYKHEENKAKTASKIYLVDDGMNSGLEFQLQEPNEDLGDDDISVGSGHTMSSRCVTCSQNLTVIISCLIRTLGPVVEESLLSLLCALGVLHSPEHQLLVLPSDSEALRHVIMKTFVGHEPNAVASVSLEDDESSASPSTARHTTIGTIQK